MAILQKHSLSLAALGVVAGLIGLYCKSNPNTHLGSFFGNAIADWTGVLVTVVMTKYLYEKGSRESNRPKGKRRSALTEFLREHSLTLFLVVTGIAWVGHGTEQQVGTSRRQHRFGVDSDSGPHPDDQAPDGSRIQDTLITVRLKPRRFKQSPSLSCSASGLAMWFKCLVISNAASGAVP
jgi:hypothetical protein